VQGSCRPTVRREDCEAHRQLLGTDGKPFALSEHFSEYKKDGLVSFPSQLKSANRLGFKPTGNPKRHHGRSVYPAPQWHFGKPA
jgi:hypothetical protein